MNQPDPLDAARSRQPPEPSLAELADAALRKIVTAIVIAAAIIAIAIYARPAPPRYQVAVGDGQVVRIDSRNGTVIACEAGQCWTVLRRGQSLERRPERAAVPKQDAPAPRALPAPPPNAAPAPR